MALARAGSTEAGGLLPKFKLMQAGGQQATPWLMDAQAAMRVQVNDCSRPAKQTKAKQAAVLLRHCSALRYLDCTQRAVAAAAAAAAAAVAAAEVWHQQHQLALQ